MTRNYNTIRIIHSRVKELLKSKKISQIKLADDLNMDKDYLNSCLRNGLVNFNLLERIAEYLDCIPLYLNREDAPLLEYEVYKSWQYDEMDCLAGLIYRSMYKPDDFDLKEKTELLGIISKDICKYAEKKNKETYNTAFWSGEGTKSEMVYITSDMEEGDTLD